MKKYIYIALFILLRACSNDPVLAQTNNTLVNDQLTVSWADTLYKTGIDTASKVVSLTELFGRFTLCFQVSIYSPADTLQMFVGTTAAFTTGMVTTILPGVPFNSAYYKIRDNLNVFIRGLSQTSVVKYYYAWIGGI